MLISNYFHSTMCIVPPHLALTIGLHHRVEMQVLHHLGKQRSCLLCSNNLQ